MKALGMVLVIAGALMVYLGITGKSLKELISYG